MRRPRLLAPDDQPVAYYHCISRIVDRRFVFDDFHKDQFRALLAELAEFCQVRILTFCLMSNHFHLLIEVPKAPSQLPSAEQTLDALEKLSIQHDLGAARQRLNALRAAGDALGEQCWLAGYHARRWNLSTFLKLLKQRFTVGFNRRNRRKGTLWEERFKSVLVEGTGRALLTMAAYIDLNPVRARLVRDPKDYRWSGYGEAVAGRADSRAGLLRLAGLLLQGREIDDATALAEYRQHLYRAGSEEHETVSEDGQTVRGAFSHETVLKVLREKGRLPASEYLHCRVRHFCDGAVFGSREFVEGVFQKFRNRFGPRRRTGAKPLPGLAEPGLFTVRQFRHNVFG